MNKQQKIYLRVSMAAVLTGLLLTQFYRPYVYSNEINDLGFADCIGSLVSVIGFCFFVWSFKHYDDSQKNKQILMATIIYGFVWEFVAVLGIHGTFDWKDIIGAIISGALAYLIKELIKKQSNSQNLLDTSQE